MSKRKRIRRAPKHSKRARVQASPGPSKGRRPAVYWLIAAALSLGAASWFLLREDRPAKPPSPEPEPVVRFASAPDGIDFVLNNGTTDDKPMPDSTLGGVAVLDCDGDGLLDVFFANGARFPDLVKSDESFHNRLYRNSGTRSFEDVTADSGVAGIGYSMGVATGDYDNDGRPDIFVAGVAVYTLYRNVGGCRFEDVTARAGLPATKAEGAKWAVAAAWTDYDSDGLLDLFVVNYLDWNWENNRVCGDPGRRLSCSPAHYRGLPNALYRNLGNGTFSDVSEQTGVANHIGKGMSAAVADYDGDGFSDIFVTNDSIRNFLFRNIGGERFEEVGVQAGMALTSDGIPVSSMGLDVRDLNGDEWPDLTITALANETFPLFVNRSGKVFTDATYESKIGLESLTLSGWSVGAFDFDNDGDRDIFTANSHVSENVGLYRAVKYRLPNAVFQLLADGTYRNSAPDAGPAMQAEAAHRGAAFGDLDNDGRIDAVVSAIGTPAAVLFNESEAGNWLILDLEGSASNRDGLGARVRMVTSSGAVHHNLATTAVGYASSSDSRVHFGLGPDGRASEIEIRWPSGTVQVLRDVEAGQVLAVSEPR